jgi:Protein of unknown function (DUF3429)
MHQRFVDDIDPETIPALSLLLGFGPMLPILIGGGATLLWPALGQSSFAGWVMLWAAAILIFIAGVRRGYGFARQARPSFGALAGTFWMFFTGLGALPALLFDPAAAAILLIAGFASVVLLDPIAARRGEAPHHFTKLRPPQMLVGLAGLAALLASRLL